MGQGQSFQQKILGKLDIQRWKKIAELLPYTIYKYLFKMDQILTLRAKTIKAFRRKQGRNGILP